MAGYPQIVSLMSQHEELAILRKFGNLSIQNLLFMQAELMHLEEKLTRIAAKEDDGSSSSLKYRDWWTLSRPNENGGNEHWEIVMDIRTKLEKYREYESLVPSTYADRISFFVKTTSFISICFSPIAQNQIRTT